LLLPFFVRRAEQQHYCTLSARERSSHRQAVVGHDHCGSSARSLGRRVVVNSAAVFGSPILCFRTNESPPDDVQTDGFAVESFPKSAEGNAGQAGAGSFSSRNSAALRVFSRARAWEESLIISSSTRSAGCARKEKKTTDGGGGGAAP